MGAGASTRPAHQQPDGLYQHTRPRMGAGARSAGRALRVHQQPLHSAGATMQAPVLLHSAAGPLSAAASLPTPGPPRCRHLSAALPPCKPGTPANAPPFRPRVRCGPTLPPVASPHLQCGPLKSPPAGGQHRAPKRVKRNSGPLRGAGMRRRAGQCWGLCSARCASHRPQQGRRCPSGRHARPPPGQAVQHAGHSVPPSPPLLSEWGQGWPLFAPRKQCGRASSAPPEGSKSGHPAKGNAACGRDGHTGDHPARVNAPPAAALAG